jgi:hypothetical protein
MFRPLLVVCAAAFGASLSCVPVARSPVPDRVWNVPPRELHRAYVGGDEERWTHQTVRVTFPAAGYEVGSRTVRWHGGRTTDGPDVVFEMDAAPPDNSKPLVLTGHVKGRTPDTDARASGHNWHVRVTGCVVTVGR